MTIVSGTADHQRLARNVYEQACALNHAIIEAARVGLVVDCTMIGGDDLPAVPRVTVRVLVAAGG